MKLDPTHPSILISAEKLKDAISYGKYGNTEHCRNMMVSRLLDAFWSSQELASYSISGKPAPGHAKETAKPKLPSDHLNAIISEYTNMLTTTLQVQM
jgi:hypothetical protein